MNLFEAALKEVEKGFIRGPTDKSKLPAGSTDYKASLVNFAVTQSEGDHTIDRIAAMVACWMRNGTIKPEDILVAKCWDLSDAYKQVPLSDDAFDLDSYLAVYDPNSESAKIFKPLSSESHLPHGR